MIINHPKNAVSLLGYMLFATSLVFSTAASSQAEPISPDLFTYKTQIELSVNGGPFYQITLPLQVYQGVQQPNLTDLRVFNQQGEAVPYAWLNTPDTPDTVVSQETKHITVPVFPIRQSTTDQHDNAEIALEFKRQTDGTLVAVSKNKMQKEVTVLRGAVLDLSQIQIQIQSQSQSQSQIQGNVSGLRIETSSTTVPFHAFDLETSDDLQQWHPLLTNAQLVHLQQGDQVIDKNTFKWTGTTGKYLRVLWRDPNQAPGITAASVISGHTLVSTPHLLWTDPIKPQKIDGNHIYYTISGEIPLEQLRFNLGEVNTLIPLQVQRYIAPKARRQQGVWKTLTQSTVYRLQSPHGEVTSPDLVLNSPPADQLRLVLDANSGGNNIPAIQIGFVPQIVIFLANGNAPFTLAWGAKGVRDGSMPYTTLLPEYRANKESTTSTATLQAIAPIPSNSQKLVDKNNKAPKSLLWGILAAGLLVLAGMAVMLLRQMRR